MFLCFSIFVCVVCLVIGVVLVSHTPLCLYLLFITLSSSSFCVPHVWVDFGRREDSDAETAELVVAPSKHSYDYMMYTNGERCVGNNLKRRTRVSLKCSDHDELLEVVENEVR
jgi:hypothetical protein